MYCIDIIIPFVNPNDVNWQNEYIKYENESKSKLTKNRFRDTSILKYVFRSINKYAFWVNNVYLVVASKTQIPEWINKQNVKIVLHEDFIPKEYLPVFNCNTIEIFMYRIPGLSEYFIYFNDDTLLINNCFNYDFFEKNKCNVYPIKQENPIGSNTWFNCLYNGTSLINNALNISENYWYIFPHTVTPYIKSVCNECFNLLETEILSRITRFREINNVNQHLYAIYAFKINKCNKKRINVVYTNLDKYKPNLLNTYCKTACINDLVGCDEQIINTNRELYIKDLEHKFNEKSKYEL